MRFEKWQALGNDYVIIERDELPFALTPARVRRICEGHFGVCADGILELSPSEDPSHVADLLIYNPDGSQAELSGNGTREAALYLRWRGWTELDTFTIGTAAREIRPTITGRDTARIDMGTAHLASTDYPQGAADGVGELVDASEGGPGTTWLFQHVSIGNPQCAIRVDDQATLSSLDLKRIGPPIEAHPAFPNRTNVSWYTELEAGLKARIRARIFERGVGETQSSGTGAVGAAIAYLLSSERGAIGMRESDRHVVVLLDGGELEVEVGEDLHVHLTGWARGVFEGRLSEDFLKELDETE